MLVELIGVAPIYLALQDVLSSLDDNPNLVDRRGLEPRSLTCKASIIPPILAAHKLLVTAGGNAPPPLVSKTSTLLLRYAEKLVRAPGFEPGSLSWQPRIITWLYYARIESLPVAS